MNSAFRARRFLGGTLLLVGVMCSGAWARTPQDAFHEAYYLEHERGDFVAAEKLYQEVLAVGGGAGDLRERAAEGLAVCREEIAASDLAALMPPETLVYAELNRPGEHLTQLLDELGILAKAQGGSAQASPVGRFGVSPVLIQQMLGIRGLAVAITGFDPAAEMPTGVAVLHPGSLELVRGALQTILPAGATPVESTPAYQTYFISDAGLYVTLTSRLVIAGPDKSLVDGVVSRLSGTAGPSFGNRPDLGVALQQREGAVLFACADAKQLLPQLLQMPGAAADLGPARVLLDLDHVDWLALRAGVGQDALDFRMTVKLAAQHHNFAYNFVRTPALTGEIFRSVPQGVAIVVAGALSESTSPTPRSTTAGSASEPAVSALDIGREIFANVRDAVVFAMPAEADRAEAGPAPDAAAVLRVYDPGRSQALWTQILGLVSLFAGAPTMDGAVEKIAGVDAYAYRFPAGVTAYVATAGDRLIVATTKDAMQRTIVASRGGSSILQDVAFATAISSMDKHTSKALLANPGRCLKMARPFMSAGEAAEVEPFAKLLGETVASVQTHEAPDQFQLALSVSGLPDVGPLLAQLIERGRHADSLRHTIAQARHHGKWDEALQAIEAAPQAERDKPELQQTRFEILALGKMDREQAVSCGNALIERFAEDAHRLNEFAWELLTNDEYGGRFSELALAAAERACQVSDYHDWMILDTLALAKFKSGDVQSAIQLQEKAIQLSPGSRKDELSGTLARYQAAHK